MEYVVFSALIVISLFYFKENFSVWILILLVTHFFLRFLFLKLSLPKAPLIGTIGNLIILLPFLYKILNALKKGIEKNYVLKIGIIIISTIIYIATLAIYRKASIFTYIHFFRNFFYGLLLLFLFINVGNPKYHKERIIRFLWLMLSIQVGIAILQYFNTNVLDFFKLKEIIWKGESQDQLGGIFNQRIVIGTLLKTTNFSNVLSVLTIFLFAQYYIFEDKSLFKLALLICSVIIIFLSGIRNSAITIILGGFLVVWLKNKKLALLFLGISILLIISFKVLLLNAAQVALENSGDFETPFQRFFAIFAFLDENG